LYVDPGENRVVITCGHRLPSESCVEVKSHVMSVSQPCSWACTIAVAITVPGELALKISSRFSFA
jgi:hypothetical protein